MTVSALVHIEPHLDPQVRLGDLVRKVIVYHDGRRVDVVSKQTYRPISWLPFSRSKRVVCGPRARIEGTSTVTNKDFIIYTIPEILYAAVRQGIAVERPTLWQSISSLFTKWDK